MSRQRVHLHSYRLAFDLERRIHRIDTFRIPLPYGVPLASLGWAAAALILVVGLSGCPLVGSLLVGIPWPLRLIFLPGLGAHLLSRPTRDGRPLHEALVARLRYELRPRSGTGLTPHGQTDAAELGACVVVPDDRGPRYRPGTIAGPCTVLLRHPALIRAGRNRIDVIEHDGLPLYEPRAVRVDVRQRLVIR